MIYFISGHRDLTEDEFLDHYIPMICRVVVNHKIHQTTCSFVVGDYEGADTMAQTFLGELIELDLIRKSTVTIFHMGKVPMNNPKHLNTIDEFSSDVERDTAMTNISQEDILWVREGKEDSGTDQNKKRRSEAV